MANGFVRYQQLFMALYVLALWSSYSRPEVLYQMLVEDLIPPSPSNEHWALLLPASEQGRPNKAGAFADSVALDHEFWRPLHPLLHAVSQKNRGDACVQLVQCINCPNPQKG